MYYRILKKGKIIFFIVLCLSIIVNLCSCSNNGSNNENKIEEKKPICKITFTSNGEVKTEQSTATPLLGQWSDVTREEYLESQHRYDGNSEIYQAKKELFVFIPLSKENSKPESIIGLTDKDINTPIYLSYYRWGAYSNYETYETTTFLGFVYNYVYVDIIDNQTISVTTWQGTTVYTVTSYSITYFDDLK